MQNAIIKSTSLGLDDHRIFTAWIHLSGSGWGCGFGGYVTGPCTKEWIVGVLVAAGVSTWEELPGKLIRVPDTRTGSSIKKIVHIMDDSVYFDAEEWSAQAKAQG